MKSLLCCLPIAAIVAAACAGTTSFSMSSFGRSSSGGDEQVTIPTVFKLKRDAAIAALRRAGVKADISEDSSLCGSTVDGKLIETGEVCYQFPPAGREQGARLPVTIRVQTEDPRRGNVGTHNEWRLMPNLIGKTYEQALAEMRHAGFTQDDRLRHGWADETTCRPLVVCRQYPEATERAGINSDKIIYVGQDPNAKKRTPATDDSLEARETISSQPTGRTPLTEPTRVEPPKTDPAKKEDEELPPLFGAPAPKPTP
jgi:beta-lactam-binding protein with PASTA domain